MWLRLPGFPHGAQGSGEVETPLMVSSLALPWPLPSAWPGRRQFQLLPWPASYSSSDVQLLASPTLPEHSGSPHREPLCPAPSYSGGQPGPREALNQEAGVWAETQLGYEPRHGFGRLLLSSVWAHFFVQAIQATVIVAIPWSAQTGLGLDQVTYATSSPVLSPLAICQSPSPTTTCLSSQTVVPRPAAAGINWELVRKVTS